MREIMFTMIILGPIVIETDGKDFSKFSRYYKISSNKWGVNCSES